MVCRAPTVPSFRTYDLVRLQSQSTAYHGIRRAIARVNSPRDRDRCGCAPNN